MDKMIASDYDSGWKEILEGYFKEFLLFYFPQIHNDIDFTKAFAFLDNEFNKIVKESEEQKRRVDKLVRVYLKDGREQWLLIHIEIQGSYEKDFSQRIYVYNYRIFDRYKKEVITLVILADLSKNYRPDKFEINRWGFRLLCQYPLIKLIDYKGNINLDESKDPFGIITFAHLKNLETIKDYNERLFWKITLVKKLYEKGYSKRDILRLYRFIDWIMALPKDLTTKFKDEIINYEEGLKMPYITSIERLGIEEGMEKGMIKNAQQMLIEVLQERFGVIDSQIQQKIVDITSHDILSGLFRKSLKVSALEEFQEELRKI